MTASLRLVTMVAALLLSLTSLAPLTSAAPASPQPDVAAAQLRRKGEEAMVLGQYDKAIEHFTALIALDPSPASYLKRAAVSQRRRDWPGVISDATAAVAAAAADPASDQARIKALSLRGQALTHRGECEAAVPDLVAAGPEAAQHLDRAQRCASAFATLTAARARMPAAFTSSSASAANGAAAVERVPPQLRAQLMDALDGVISLQLGTPDDYLERARLNFALGKYHEAIMDTRNVLQARAESIPALLLRGDAYYMLSEHPNAVTHYKKGLGSDPEHRELQKRFKNVRKIMKKLEEAEEASQRGQHVKAVEAYAAAAAIDKRQRPILDEIDVKTCAALLKANGKGKDALAACQRVADKPGASAEAWCQVGEAHMVMEQWAAAEQVFTKAMQMDQNSRAAREGMQRAQLEAKKASRKDYYKILGVGKKAGKREIKKAYLKLAKQFHPDMVSGEKEKEEAEARFHDVGEAYEILSDDEKRGRYDRGEDIEMPQGRPRGGQGFPFPFANFGGGGGGGAFHFSFG